MNITVIHGVNLNMLGQREPEVYGKFTLEEINDGLKKTAEEYGVDLTIRQSNYEGEIVEIIQKSIGNADGIVINPGAYTHTSVAIRDAVSAVKIPVVEVHISNIYAREEFRSKSLIAPVCAGQISGFGVDSYALGLIALVKHLKTNR